MNMLSDEKVEHWSLQRRLCWRCHQQLSVKSVSLYIELVRTSCIDTETITQPKEPQRRVRTSSYKIQFPTTTTAANENGTKFHQLNSEHTKKNRDLLTLWRPYSSLSTTKPQARQGSKPQSITKQQRQNHWSARRQVTRGRRH